MEKTLDICGFGNALVDLQFEINDQGLSIIGLTKGEMKLVSKEEQIKILETLEGGPFNKCSGGSAANTIIAFSAFGGKSAYKTVLGKDHFGDFYAKEFETLGIELIADRIESEPTGTCVVLISPDSERTMHTCLGATSMFNSSLIDEEVIQKSKWLYVEGYKFSEKPSTEAVYEMIKIAKKSNTKIAVTFSDVFITENFRDELKFVVDNCDLIFCNENEAKSYTEKKQGHEAFELLCKKGTNVAMTLGAMGSVMQWDGKQYNISRYKASPVDSTGAGDIYAGAFMYGILYLNNPEKAGHLASLASARIVSQMGARLSEDHKALINRL